MFFAISESKPVPVIVTVRPGSALGGMTLARLGRALEQVGRRPVASAREQDAEQGQHGHAGKLAARPHTGRGFFFSLGAFGFFRLATGRRE